MTGYSDFVRASNIADNPDIYEKENRAIDPSGDLWSALRDVADWSGRTLVDLGCGTGFWLSRYADIAERVIGIEPDEALRVLALKETVNPPIQVLAGSAEHLPLPDESVDIIHARFAYFFPPHCEPGLHEALRVLRPGGTLAVIDNDLRHGEFAELVRQSPWAEPQGNADVADEWWQRHGGRRREVMSAWSCANHAELEEILRIELPGDLVDVWLKRFPGRTSLSYGYVLFAVTRST